MKDFQQLRMHLEAKLFPTTPLVTKWVVLKEDAKETDV